MRKATSSLTKVMQVENLLALRSRSRYRYPEDDVSRPLKPSTCQALMIDWTPLADLIETHDRFLVTTHVRPDGDALGSEVGMAGLLRQKGKDVRVVNASPTPPRYDFLDPDGSLFEHFGKAVHPADLADRQVAVILDLSAWSQLGDMAEYIRSFPGPRLVIDHHVSQDDLGAHSSRIRLPKQQECS